MRVDLQAAEQYLTALDETAEFFTWQTFDDAAKGRHDLISIQHGALEDLSERLIQMNDRGAGIYIAVNETDGKGRKIENVTRVRAVFADLDGAPLAGVEACELEPHMIVESSKGKYHAYWLVDGLPLDEFKPIQQVIAARFESDPSVNDLPRILRVPGFIHRKADPYQVRILNYSGALPYSADEIRRVFPPADAAKQSGYAAAPETEAKGFHAHLKMVGHHAGGGGFHWPITRAIAAYISQYGKDAPVEPLKAIIRATVDRADRSNYTDAQLNNIKSNVYLDRAIHGALLRFGDAASTGATVGQVAQKVAAAGSNVVHLTDKKPGKAEEAEHPLTWQDRLTRSQKGELHASVANIALILEHDTAWQGVLAFDRFSLKTIKTKRPPFAVAYSGEWEDKDDTKTCIWLSDNYQMRPATNTVAEAVGVVAELNSFHPVKQYFATLEWDGKHRAKTWMARYLGAKDTPYIRLVSQCWLVGAVARIMRPGCKMDNVLILEGAQGRGKSSALGVLGGEWFTDTPFELGSKDGFLSMRGKWIIELAELDSFNRAESTRAKHFFAASFDTYREPYGRRVIDVQRQCVFAGTTNSDEYLKDESGNRRYWPVRCNDIDLDSLRRDRDQLWAEALHLLKAGEKWWFEAGLDYVSEEQEKRFQTDAWETRIGDFIAEKKKLHNPGLPTPFHVSIGEILQDCLDLPPGKWGRPEQMRASAVLKRLGYIRKQLMIDNRRTWVYAQKFNE